MNYKYEHLVVAYGSNLCEYDFLKFVQKNGGSKNCLHFEEVVFLPDHEICFDTYSKGRKGGVLNIKKSLGCITEAGLFSATSEGLELLRKKEGVPFKYEEVKIVALDSGGNEINALTYIVPQERTDGFVVPHADYLKVCEDGFNFRGIDTLDLTNAAENKKIEPWSALFTYGTLMRSESRYQTIRASGVKCALMAQCFGSLSTNRSFPALNLNGSGFSWGDYFVSNDIVSLLEKTDQIEGFFGYGSSNNLFRRTFVQVDVGRLRHAWLYVMDKELDFDIPSNDWRKSYGNRLKFVSDVYRSHSAAKPNFDENVTSRLYRFGCGSNKTELQSDEIIKMLDNGKGVTEFDLAKVTNLWAAETG